MLSCLKPERDRSGKTVVVKRKVESDFNRKITWLLQLTVTMDFQVQSEIESLDSAGELLFDWRAILSAANRFAVFLASFCRVLVAGIENRLSSGESRSKSEWQFRRQLRSSERCDMRWVTRWLDVELFNDTRRFRHLTVFLKLINLTLNAAWPLDLRFSCAEKQTKR